MQHIQDKGYRYLFLKKKVFLELLQGFGNVDWMQALDPSSLVMIDKLFTLPDGTERKPDALCQLAVDGRTAHGYGLLENQSAVSINRGETAGFRMGFERVFKEALDKAELAGLTKGIEQGIEQGKEQGFEWGERKAKPELARALLTKGVLHLDQMAELTGLSEAEIPCHS